MMLFSFCTTLEDNIMPEMNIKAIYNLDIKERIGEKTTYMYLKSHGVMSREAQLAKSLTCMST